MDETLCCSVCNQKLARDQFSKKQLKKLESEKFRDSIKCITCSKVEERTEQPQVLTEEKTEDCVNCSACKQSLPQDKFSKKQLKKYEDAKTRNSVKCIDCNKAEETNEKIVSKEKKVQKLQDPSQLYFLHPLNAPIIKDFERFFSGQFGLKSEITLGKKTKWRTAVKLAVRGELSEDRKLTTEVGLFAPGTHKVFDCSNSPAHHPRINEAVLIVKKGIAELNIGGYIEGTAADDKKIGKYRAYLRYILISVERKSGLVQLSLIWNSTKTNSTTATTLLNSFVDYLVDNTLVKNSEEFKYKKSKLFHSIWVHFHPADIHNNAITGRDTDSWELKFGKDYMIEQIQSDFNANGESKGANNTTKSVLPSLYFPPFVFRQANIDKFEEIIRDIRSTIKSFKESNSIETMKCLELYGGVGTIGLNCLDLVDRLNCSDENPHNLTCFNKSLEALPPNLKIRGQYRPYGAANSVKNGEIFQNNVIIIDPPRKGMDEETIKAFLSFPPDPAAVKLAAENTPANKRMKISFDDEGNANENGNVEKDLAMKRKRLIYISCGFEAFKRDCQLLTGRMSIEESSHLFHQQGDGNDSSNAGSSRKRKDFSSESAASSSPASYQNYWKLTFSKGFVLFPGSNHIETLAVFDRE